MTFTKLSIATLLLIMFNVPKTKNILLKLQLNVSQLYVCTYILHVRSYCIYAYMSVCNIFRLLKALTLELSKV